jgi:hypothetical protein
MEARRDEANAGRKSGFRLSLFPSMLWFSMSVLSGCSPSCQQTNPQEPQEPIRNPEGGTVNCEKIFDDTNKFLVQNGAANPFFTLGPKDPNALCRLYTYHWNNGNGLPPGQIGLINRTTGVTYGPYPAVGTPGDKTAAFPNGVPNVNWTVDLSPRIELKPGNYEVFDSNKPSWSWNATSTDKGWPAVGAGPATAPKAAGFAQVWTENSN